jgi:hypothetical protein
MTFSAFLFDVFRTNLCKAIKIQEWTYGNQNTRFLIKLQCSIVRYKLLVF